MVRFRPFWRSKMGGGSGGEKLLFGYFNDPGGHDRPKIPPKESPSAPTLDFQCFFTDLGSIFQRCLLHLGWKHCSNVYTTKTFGYPTPAQGAVTVVGRRHWIYMYIHAYTCIYMYIHVYTCITFQSSSASKF